MPANFTTPNPASPAEGSTRRGRFVVVEGADGAGKTDLCAGLADALRAEGRDVVALREPGGTALGEQIRTILKDPASVVCDRAEALLFAAARAQLVAEVIVPALDRGAWVLVDRFGDSTEIYQGIARGLGIVTMRELTGFATAGVTPDRVLALQIDVDVAARRMGRRDGDNPDRMEQSIDMAVIRDGYATITQRNARAVPVDANGNHAQVLAAALDALADLRSADG